MLLLVTQLPEVMREIAGFRPSASYAPADWTAGSCRAGDPGAVEKWFNWTASTDVNDGLARVYSWMKSNSRA